MGIDLNSNTGIRFAAGDEKRPGDVKPCVNGKNITSEPLAVGLQKIMANSDYVHEEDIPKSCGRNRRRWVCVMQRLTPKYRSKTQKANNNGSNEVLSRKTSSWKKFQSGEYGWLDYVNHHSPEWQEELHRILQERKPSQSMRKVQSSLSSGKVISWRMHRRLKQTKYVYQIKYITMGGDLESSCKTSHDAWYAGAHHSSGGCLCACCEGT